MLLRTGLDSVTLCTKSIEIGTCRVHILIGLICPLEFGNTSRNLENYIYIYIYIFSPLEKWLFLFVKLQDPNLERS